MQIEDVMNRHEKIVLQFSGGKDSVAVILLLREYWERITVLWCNTGDCFPETIKIVNRFKEILPNFCEVNSDVKSFRKEFGYSSDIVPSYYTKLGEVVGGHDDIKTCSSFECTSFNIWQPTMNKTIELGATLIIRGQRNDEKLKSPIKSGHIENGIEYLFPIEGWSKEYVIEYLKSQNFDIPDHFYFEESSLDCMGCTGFVDKHHDRLDWMMKNHPDQHKENLSIITKILSISDNVMCDIRNACGGIQ